MFKKEYFYHVVYAFSKGRGTITIIRNKKIKTSDDIRELAKYIESEYAHEKVNIENWIRIKA